MKKHIIVALGVILAVGSVSAQVLAHEGHVHGPGGNRGTVAENRGGGAERGQAAREAAQQRVTEIKERVEEKKTRIKQDVCERRQEQIQRIMPRLATGATARKTAFDTIYERVQGFYDSGQLTVSNYDELKADVDAAQLDAEAAIGAVETFEFELDCEAGGVGEQLSGYREAVNEAKEALKAYRVELVELISALRAEAAEADAETDGSDTTDDGQEDSEDATDPDESVSSDNEEGTTDEQ